MLAHCISFVPTYQIKNVKKILMEQNDIYIVKFTKKKIIN